MKMLDEALGPIDGSIAGEMEKAGVVKAYGQLRHMAGQSQKRKMEEHIETAERVRKGLDDLLDSYLGYASLPQLSYDENILDAARESCDAISRAVGCVD